MSVADVIQYIQWYITNDYILNCTVESWKGLRLNSQTAPKTHEALYNLRYPAKPSPNEIAATDLYRETVAAVQQEANAQAEAEQKPTLPPEQLAAGWIEWHGGYPPPVSGGDYVQCLMRNAMTISSYGHAIDFNHTDSDYDIMAYRIREKEPEVPQADTFTEQIELERKAPEELTATVDEIEATVLRWATEQATTEQTPLNSQVGGDHYKKLGPYQPWEVLARWLTPEELRGFAKGTVIAYLARERDKGGDADIAKAQHTLEIWQHLSQNVNSQKTA